MSLAEYKRKRRFEATPEPPPEVQPKSQHRFVVQRHEASRLHYDFRLELEGVLKSWAVPKGPSLDPADKRLAMQVEDHPVSYFDFEGVIPEGNYGAGTVMVWDVGTWQPLSPKPVQGKFVPGTDEEALAMLTQGDFKFRLAGKKISGDFALVRMRSRRPGSKGTEWLLIKKRDEHVVGGYDPEQETKSVLSNRTMKEIAVQRDAEWVSRPAGRGKLKAAWLAEAVAKLDRQKQATTESAESAEKKKAKQVGPRISRSGTDQHRENSDTQSAQKDSRRSQRKTKAPTAEGSGEPERDGAPRVIQSFPGKRRAPMPAVVHPMLATPWDDAFDSEDWLFEIKWDGYRAITFVGNGKARLVSRNQNDMTAQFSELEKIAAHLSAKTAVLDGEIVALDEAGRSSFSLMQQRSGFSARGRRGPRDPQVPVVYYAFDLLYLDGYDLRRVPLEQRKQALAAVVQAGEILRYSDHQVAHGVALLSVAQKSGLEGILAKRRASFYEERRSTDWRKIKITQRMECVIGGYTEPQGSREFFGSVVLGLHNRQGKLVHVGQAGSGFDQKMQKEIWTLLEARASKRNPFAGEVQALRAVHWVKPQLVAEIKFAEWTHERQLRSPVFLGLREDKSPEECELPEQMETTR
jgi:bifunctional non-homologous end joining protein LigD